MSILEKTHFASEYFGYVIARDQITMNDKYTAAVKVFRYRKTYIMYVDFLVSRISSKSSLRITQQRSNRRITF